MIPQEFVDKYKVTTYWEGKLYIGIALNWEYEKGTVQLSMIIFVRVALHSFQKKPQYHRTHHTPGKTNIWKNNNILS